MDPRHELILRLEALISRHKITKYYEIHKDRCIKASVMKPDGSYTMVRCAVQRDIFARMYSDRPISQRSYDACQKLMCPYSVAVRKPRIKKIQGPTLFEDETTEDNTPQGDD